MFWLRDLLIVIILYLYQVMYFLFLRKGCLFCSALVIFVLNLIQISIYVIVSYFQCETIIIEYFCDGIAIYVHLRNI